MLNLTVPDYWTDLIWMKNRGTLFDRLSSKEDLLIDFKQCNWIDLQPLCDLLLQLSLRTSNSRRTFLQLEQRYPRSLNRVTRFLLETGFVGYLAERLPEEWITVIRGDSQQSLPEFVKFAQECSMPEPLLNYETILPCSIVEIESDMSRESIFAYCKDLRYKTLGGGRGRSHGIPPLLITQVNMFFDSVLPELIDNTRLHKLGRGPKFAAIYGRLRRREDRLYLPRNPLASYLGLSRLKRVARHLWQNDVFEFVISDHGETIQESWLCRCNGHRSRSRKVVPRLPSGIRVDGPDGNAILLEGVFNENASSLSKRQRQEEKLTVSLTGLHSIQQTIMKTEWYFSANSGPSHSIVYYDKQEHLTKIVRGERLEGAPGVHYQFLVTTEAGPPIPGWEHAGPYDARDSSLWGTHYEEYLTNIEVVETYEEIEKVQDGGCVVCRANYVPWKESLSRTLTLVRTRGLRLVFAEIRSPIALRLYLLIESLRRYNSNLNEISIPIVTDNLQYAIAGKVGPDSRTSARQQKADPLERYWNNWKLAPGESVQTIFLRCRQYDSRRFSEYLLNDDYAFLREPVKWRDDLVLAGGFLAFTAATRETWVRKMIRDRLIITLNALGTRTVIPGSPSVHLMYNEVRARLSGDDRKEGSIGIITDVVVPGPSISMKPAYHGPDDQSMLLPIFVYPYERIFKDGAPIKSTRASPRVMDWPALVSDEASLASSEIAYSSYGKSGRIRRKPDEELQVFSKQQPSEAYNIWQTEDLFRIGHFHYQHYHYFIWLDLLKLIASRTAQSNQMLDAIAQEIASTEAGVLLYSPNEVTEALMSRLYSGYKIEMPMYPVTAIKSRLYVGAVEVDISLVSRLVRGRPKRAVFIDDALVSGETIRQVRSALARLGFEEVKTLVLLDRAVSEVELLELDRSKRKHFSWWSLNVPPMGTPETCRMCRAIGHLRVLRNQTELRTLREVVAHWIKWWSVNSDQTVFEDRLERGTLKEPIAHTPRRLSTNTVRLRSSDAVTTWILDMMSRFEYFSFLLDERRPEYEGCLSELLSGLVLLYWDHLNRFEKRKAVNWLVERIWEEQRETARSLIAVSLASLDGRSLDFAATIVEQRLFKKGIPNLDAATLIHTVFNLQAGSYADARENLAGLSERFMGDSGVRSVEQGQENDLERARSFLQLYERDRLPITRVRQTMMTIGIPGRGLRHNYVYDRLWWVQERVGEGPTGELQEVLLQIRAFLEPLRSVIDESPALFDKHGVLADVTNLLDEFDGFSLVNKEQVNGEGGVPVWKPEKLRETSVQLTRFLADNIPPDKLCVRDIIYEEYLHYLPDEVQAIAEGLEEKEPETYDNAFTIKHPETKKIRGSQMLLDFTSQSYDIVLIPKLSLVTLLRDLLSDVRHVGSASGSASQRGPAPRMRVSFSLAASPTDGSERYVLRLENQASVEEAMTARASSSWSIVGVLMEDAGGETACEFDPNACVLSRSLYFRFIKGQRKDGGDGKERESPHL